MKRLAILLNIIAPYRVPVLAQLAKNFDTLVLHGGAEPNRSWSVELPAALRARKVFSLQIPVRKRNGVAGVTDTSYLHLDLGLIGWLFRFRPQIIISNEMGLRTLIALLYGKLARVPVWVWWGGTIHSERNITRPRKYLRRILVRLVRHWISYGLTTTEYLCSIGVRREQILEIQNCVPQETFQTEPPLGATMRFAGQPRPVLLYVGQFLARKGLDKLIEACGRAAARGQDFTLVLVGKGPEEDQLRRLATACGVRHLELLPNQDQAVLNELYRAADVFLFPTLEDVWGLVVNEAMWAGTPVLCSCYAGCAAELLPAANIFDPLSRESFDAALDKAIAGAVPPPDQSRLLTWQQVGELLCTSLEKGAPVRPGGSACRPGRTPAPAPGWRANSNADRQSLHPPLQSSEPNTRAHPAPPAD